MRGFSFLTVAVPLSFTFAQATISLGAASTFGALSRTSITNIGPTDIVGDIGTIAAFITGFPPGTYTGSRYLVSQALDAFAAAEAAYEAVAALTGAITLSGNLGGRVLSPGVYNFPSSAQLTGVLVLAGTGNCNDAWYFQVGSTLTTGVGSSVVITGGASGNVFWKVGASANVGIGSDFIGNILAQVSVTLNAEASIEGGVFALGASTTLNNNFIQPMAICASVSSSTQSSTSSGATSSMSSSPSSSPSSSSTSLAAPSSSSSPISTTTSSSSSSTLSVATSSTSSQGSSQIASTSSSTSS
ncbi:hypothetical protein LCER1_G008281, partial [Lachnellula cervina]